MQKQRSQRRKNADTLISKVLSVFLILAFLLFAAIAALVLRSGKLLSPVVSSESPTAPMIFTAPAPSATWTLEPSPVVSPTPQIYVVQPNDTLSGIAVYFGVTVEAIKIANFLTSDTIFPDQQLIIPNSQVVGVPSTSVPSSPGAPVATGEISAAPASTSLTSPWRFSPISGDLGQSYSMSIDTDRFTLHYQPNSFTSEDPQTVAQMEMEGLNFLEAFTGAQLQSRYDVYVAGSNFEPPNRGLRGITFSSLLRTFFLHDGTGNLSDQQYISTHELTHLFMWHVAGSPSSTMLAEGVAVYLGMERIAGSAHLPIESFCAAYLQADALPRISGTLSFQGHTADLENYYAAGCFVKFLVNTYGIESLKLVYHSGNYAGVYGQSLGNLENDWRTYLAPVPAPAGMDPSELTSAVHDLEGSYENFFSNFGGSPAQLDAYYKLDQARIALLQGQLAEMRNYLLEFNEIR